MKTQTTTTTCDVCGSNVDADGRCTPRLQVLFHTEQTEGRGTPPYLSSVEIDLCVGCYKRVLGGEYIHATGAQNNNHYYFKNKNKDDKWHATYWEWLTLIVGSRDSNELIQHFRKHVGEHWEHHDRAGELSKKIWMTGVLNFADMFRMMYEDISEEDLLYKLCRHWVAHGEGPAPPFDAAKFIAEYNGELKTKEKGF